MAGANPDAPGPIPDMFVFRGPMPAMFVSAAPMPAMFVSCGNIAGTGTFAGIVRCRPGVADTDWVVAISDNNKSIAGGGCGRDCGERE